MLLKCPNCGTHIRMSTPVSVNAEQIVRYFCSGCEKIVRLDIVSDEIQTSSAVSRPQISHSIRILVVDDTVSFLKLAEVLLSKEGYVVISAQDGVEALRKLTEEHPDAILLDLFMPKMSGFEVLRAIRTNNHFKSFRRIPVLVTSAAYNPAESQLLHDLEADGFINKDAISEFLIYRMRKILERSDKIPKSQLPLADLK
jgi:CheY-like chemotaxis protein